MQKPVVMLAVVGGLIAAGIALSFYGSMVIIEGFVQDTKDIGGGEEMTIVAALDPKISAEGIFAVQVMPPKDTVSATVRDPAGRQVAAGKIVEGSLEESFEVSAAGEFTLAIENSGEDTYVAGALGHAPGTGKILVGAAGFYILIIGLVGMGVVGIYAVKSRRT